VNERITELEEVDPLILMCECGELDCKDALEITPPKYEAIRATGERFFLVSGHEDAAVDRVVEETARFLVVRSSAKGATSPATSILAPRFCEGRRRSHSGRRAPLAPLAPPGVFTARRPRRILRVSRRAGSDREPIQ
jgi:hypothetical protein